MKLRSTEPEFLHAVATPLSIATLLVDSLQESLKLKLGAEAGELTQLEDLMRTLEKIRGLLRERREVVS